MFRFVLLLGVCQAWQHFLSFNDKCSAEFSFLKGSKLESTVTGGRLPYQFKFAMQEVLKARVASEKCTVSAAQHELFFGLNVQNILRLVDSKDTTLTSVDTVLPAGCDVFDFNWKKIKEGFKGVVLPSTCTSASYQATKKCQAKLKILENFYVEAVIQENCNNEAENGFGLPTFNVFCSGSLCDSFVRPCVTNSDCGAGGPTCDSIEQNLTKAVDVLVEMGLFNSPTDSACDTGAPFGNKFGSAIMNSAAYLLGLTSQVSTNVYSEVKLCGIGSFFDKFIPPPPPDVYRCDSGAEIPGTQVCDSMNQCPGGEDEVNCCGGTNQRDGSGNCCPICPHDDRPECSNRHCANQNQGPDLSGICPKPAVPTDPISCPDFLFASTTPIPAATSQPLKSVAPATTTQHVIGWADCEGNIQLGSPSELAVLNGRLPFQNIMAEVERVVKSLETCRGGNAPTSTTWARNFFPWAVSLWGGVFYSDQSKENIFFNINPGAKIDDAIRYYGLANSRRRDQATNSDVYVVNPPFANVANAPASCDLASTTGANPSCELAADIGSLFNGFPAGWNGPTALKVKFASSCTSSSVPTVFATCEGPCSALAQSGCCIMRNAFTTQPTPGSCPTGYKLTLLDSQITDFLFRIPSAALSNDTSVLNFFSLMATRQIKFGTGAAPFIKVDGTEAERSICVIDANSFGTNMDTWGTTAATEDCPVPASPPNGTKGCPQFLNGGLRGCSGTACLTAPVVSNCNPQCPVAPTPEFRTSSATLLTPVLGIVGLLTLF